ISRESDFWILLHVQKVGAAKVVVALGLATPEISGVDFDRDRGLLRMFGIKPQRALDALEIPTDAGDHHVANAKLGRRMTRLECPFHARMSNPGSRPGRASTRVPHDFTR